MRHTTTAIAAGLLLALTACTSSSEEPTPEKPAASVPGNPAPKQPAADGSAELEKAVRAYSAAYFKPDATTAYGMLSARCKGQVAPEIYKPMVEAAAKDYGHQQIRSVKVDLISGDTGLVSYSYDVPKLDQPKQKWAREGGQWRYDGC